MLVVRGSISKINMILIRSYNIDKVYMTILSTRTMSRPSTWTSIYLINKIVLKVPLILPKLLIYLLRRTVTIVLRNHSNKAILRNSRIMIVRDYSRVEVVDSCSRVEGIVRDCSRVEVVDNYSRVEVVVLRNGVNS